MKNLYRKTLIVFMMISAALFLACSSGSNTSDSNTQDSDYFSDDFDVSLCSFYDKFNGNSLDTSKWGYQDGNGSAYGLWGWGNNEAQAYRGSTNAVVADGKLSLVLKKENYDGMNYTSAKLVTAQALPAHDPHNPSDSTSQSDARLNKFSQVFGRFEAKIRMTKAAAGLWPAFWMMPQAGFYGIWPRSGEIDIMEMKGSKPRNASSTIHVMPNWDAPSFWGSSEYTFENNSTITDWHVYGVEWKAGEIIYLIDGKQHGVVRTNPWNTQWYKDRNYSVNAPFDKDFFLILNFAVGGWFSNGAQPPDSELPISMEVDWVRVYTLEKNPWTIPPENYPGTGSIHWQ